MGRVHKLESRMVTGEVAFLAARLFALESQRQINRVNERLGEALDTIELDHGTRGDHQVS